MSDLQKRQGYVPRQVRERQLYRYAIGGFVTGLLGVVGVVLAIVGVIGATLPIIALLIAAVCAFMARRVISS